MKKKKTRSRRRTWIFASIALLVVAGGIGGALGLRATATRVAAAPATILGWEPGIAAGVPLAGPLTVFFSGVLDRGSVERAWKISPKVAGTFSWTSNSLSFRPDVPFHAGSYYRVSIGESARDAQHRPLHGKFSVAFSTGSPLKVLGKTPAPGTAGVPVNALVSITFNHPMVALAGFDVSTPDPPGWKVAISPSTAGHGSWLGTSTWVFHPDGGLLPSSKYNIALTGSAKDAWGEALGSALHWSFNTATPAVLSETPRGGSSDANPQGDVRVVFNQPMDAASTRDAFSLRSSASAVAGTSIVKAGSLAFHPAAALDPNLTYRAAVGGGARSSNGRALLRVPVSWTFRVAPPPQVVSSTPFPGETSANGYVELHFSAPMDGASLDRSLKVAPAISGMNTYTGDQTGAPSNTYSINGQFQPSTSYSVSLGGGARDAFGRSLTAPFTLHFTTAPLQPFASLYGPAGAEAGIKFSTGRVVNAPVQFVNVPEVHVTLVRTSISSQFRNGPSFGGILSVPIGPVIRSWSQAVPAPLNKIQNTAVSLATAGGKALPAGIYWLGVQGPLNGNQTASSSELVYASNVGVTLKTASNEALAWVTSAATGRALGGVPVRLIDDNGNEIVTARTDSRGTVLIHFSSQKYVQSAVVDDGTHFGAANAGWYPGQPNYSEMLNPTGQYTPPPNGSYLYTDRPIYRPGQTVHFRGLMWQDRDAVYAAYGSHAVTVTAYQAKTVYAKALTLDRFGSFSGSFQLGRAASTGQVNLSVGLRRNQSVATTSVTIAEYRKPEFLTSVSADRKSYVDGQSVDATVQVRYVFGAAVAGQRVTWAAYSQNRFQSWPGYETYQFGDEDAIQQMYMQANGFSESQLGMNIAQGSGITDDAGRLAVHLPLSMAKDATDQTVTIEATTTDINHQSVSGRVQVVALKSGYEIGLASTQQVVAAGSRDAIRLVTLRPDGSPAASQQLQATVYRRTYTSKLAETNSSQTTLWQQVSHDTSVSQQQVTTDSHGAGNFSFVPSQGGDYYVVVTGPDGRSNTARGAIFVYSSAAGFSDWGGSNDTSIALKPDRSTYRVGQTAHILVAAPFKDSTALVTVERGTIRSYRVLHLVSNSPVLDVPLTAADIPNIYVSVSLYRGWRAGSPPDWRYGSTELRLSLDPKRLIVHLSQDRARYHPGDPVRYTVTTTDTHGKPVSAQLSFALVDTAVLALQDETNADILRALYGERPLGISTASDGVVSIDHLQQQPTFQVGPRGGGAGGGGGGAPVTFYHRFADTGYWSANLVTDSSGHASVRVRLPDNFTTWRLDARGVSRSLQVGQARLLTVSTQDVVLRPVTPRFLVQGDTVRLGVIVNNTVPSAVQTDVSLSGAGVSAASSRRSITVPGRGERLLLWAVTVPVSSSANLTFHSASRTRNVQSYAVGIRLPVEPPLTDETVATSGPIFGDLRQYVMLPASAVARPGSLTVSISSALTAGMGKAAVQFAPISYESNEDLANRAIAASALQAISPPTSGLSATTYARFTKSGIPAAAKLTANQLSDGGWPWFNSPGNVSDVRITTDAIQALSRYYGTQNPTLRRGRAFLESALPAASPQLRARILAALALSPGGSDVSATNALYADAVARAQLDPSALADLAIALEFAGNGHARSLASELDARAMVSATGAHWETSATSGESAVEATARALAALERISPADPFVPASARWLMLARQGNAWDCPHDSAQALTSLSAFARKVHENQVSYHYSVALNGSGRAAGTESKATRTISIPASELHSGTRSSLTVAARSVRGVHPLYYVARLRYYLKASAIAARNEGLSVSRRYLDLHGNRMSSAAAGSVVRVQLTIDTGQTLSYLDVEDPIPAGFEPIDASLKTSRQGLFPAWQLAATGRDDLTPYLDHTDLHDNRVSLYAHTLPPGTYHFSYLAQATVAGGYEVAPSHASESFFPEVFGRSAGVSFVVR